MKSQLMTPPLISATASAAHLMPATRPSAMERIIARVLGRIRNGRVRVTFPDGRTLECGNDPDGIQADMTILDPRLVRRLVLGGSLGFAEGYVEGEWDSPDLPALLDLLCGNMDYINGNLATHWAVSLARKIGHRLNANSRRGSRRNIAFHYDLGNDFYSRWLDPGMTYSAALFESPRMSLDEAQAAKNHRLARALDLRPGHRVLEIGCGWGGFAELAARDYGADVTAITLSREQYDYASARIAAAGLDHKVKIRYQDYRDVTGEFDRIASIEMFEAVGEAHWPTYFDVVRNRLKPGGSAGLQIITIDHRLFDYYRRTPDFIQSYIFPGGMLPSPDVFEDRVKAAGLTLADVFTFGLDYARTLGHWRRAFLDNWKEMEAIGFDEKFRRLWLYYLTYCEAGFLNQRIDVGHYLLTRPTET